MQSTMDSSASRGDVAERSERDARVATLSTPSGDAAPCFGTSSISKMLNKYLFFLSLCFDFVTIFCDLFSFLMEWGCPDIQRTAFLCAFNAVQHLNRGHLVPSQKGWILQLCRKKHQQTEPSYPTALCCITAPVF